MQPVRVRDPGEVNLVRRFVETREERAFRALHRAHATAMLAVAWRWLGGARPDAEDIVQEAWLRAAENLAAFRWESSLRTWLCGIVIHCARNRLRGFTGATGHAVEATNLAGPASLRIPASVMRIDVEQALAQLPDGYREVVNLHDVLGYTHEEIAEMLGVDAGTSKSQLSRARAALRRWLREKGTREDERRSG